MVDKKKILLDSVRKLIDLKVPDEEIVLHLKEVGVHERQARKLIRLAKQPQKEKEAVEKKEKRAVEERKAAGLPKKEEIEAKKPEVSSKKLSELAKQISAQTAAEEKPAEKKKPKEVKTKPEEKPSEEAKPVLGAIKALEEEKVPKIKPISVAAPPEPSVKPEQAIDISKLWEKGILSSVDQRLREMKEIRQELDKVIAKKADEVAKKEINKVQVLFDSQQKLFLSKVNTELEKKGKEVEELVDQKIVEMKETSKELKKEMVLLEKKRQQYKEFMEDVDSKLTDLDETKNKLVREMNSELIRGKSSIQEFLDSANAKICEMDDRVNKTIEVGANVIEGLKADAEKKLQHMAIARSDELNKDVRDELNELRDTRLMFESHLKERLNSLDELQRAIQREFEPGMFRQQMTDLEIFKKQFVRVIETNVDKFNEAIQRLNEQAKTLEEQINKRVRLIDRKMKELDDFEKAFAEEMGLAVEKVFEKKKAKKKKKQQK